MRVNKASVLQACKAGQRFNSWSQSATERENAQIPTIAGRSK